MNKKNLTVFRNRLLRELADLKSGADCNFDDLNVSEENSADLIDRASNFIDRSLARNICDRENFRIRKILQALDDIATGDYGTCEHCGEAIPLKRLKANPIARHCVRCKNEIETIEGLTKN